MVWNAVPKGLVLQTKLLSSGKWTLSQWRSLPPRKLYRPIPKILPNYHILSHINSVIVFIFFSLRMCSASVPSRFSFAGNNFVCISFLSLIYYISFPKYRTFNSSGGSFMFFEPIDINGWPTLMSAHKHITNKADASNPSKATDSSTLWL